MVPSVGVASSGARLAGVWECVSESLPSFGLVWETERDPGQEERLLCFVPQKGKGCFHSPAPSAHFSVHIVS